MGDIACPVGGHPDAVQRVQAICVAGTASGRHPALASQTNLAELLGPPEEPVSTSAWSGRSRWLFLAWAVFGIAPSAAVIGAIFAGAFGLKANDANNPLTLIGLVLSAVVWVGIAVLWFQTLSKREASRKRSFERQRARWEQLAILWNQAFYCHKDALVFDPTAGASWSIAEFHAAMHAP